MNISYSDPLSRAWARMKKALFKPFNLNKWVNVGFTAWLATFTDCNGSSGSNNSNIGNKQDFGEFFDFPQTAWQWLNDHTLWFSLIVVGVVLLIVLTTVLMWLSSRGKFMFLYNVVNDKDEVRKPWADFKKQGNSLFVWQFFYSWIIFFIVIGFFIFGFLSFKKMYFGGVPDAVKISTIVSMVLAFLFFLIFFGYISLFLKDFVVPIMYKHKLSVGKAWLKFLSLFGKNLGPFIVYGLFIFVLSIGVAITIIFFALATCCIGLLLLVIPVVGAIILLPVTYTFRAFSIEFLGQFGDGYILLPEETSSIESLTPGNI